MEKPYELGEILIFQNGNHSFSIPRNNTECELIGLWDTRLNYSMNHTTKQMETELKDCYRIIFPDGQEFNCQPHQLRRRKPPKREIDQKVSWEDCLWNPHKITEPA